MFNLFWYRYPWLKTTLVQCAWCAIRKKDTYYRAQFHHLKTKRGPKKAVVAVAASILTAIYHMLKSGTAYRDLGSDHFDKQDQEPTHERYGGRSFPKIQENPGTAKS